jgi:hypothetical protein
MFSGPWGFNGRLAGAITGIALELSKYLPPDNGRQESVQGRLLDLANLLYPLKCLTS